MRMPTAASAFGLRTRLVLAFLLVAAVSAVTTAALTYREARSAVLVRAQDTAVASFREEAERFVPSLPLEPESLRWNLYDIAARAKPHPWIVFAEYGSLRASSGDRPVSGVLTAELRRTAHTSPHGTFERVVKDGKAYLTIGMPVMTRVVAGGRAVPSGLVLFAVMPMTNEEVDIDALVTAARDG
ncbi:two-component sensor histidine kinase, partial [Streptomyces sp. MBT57]|nr:two-component sensor histidine kinase [Streptomyces sp. MBT57]